MKFAVAVATLFLAAALTGCAPQAGSARPDPQSTTTPTASPVPTVAPVVEDESDSSDWAVDNFGDFEPVSVSGAGDENVRLPEGIRSGWYTVTGIGASVQPMDDDGEATGSSPAYSSTTGNSGVFGLNGPATVDYMRVWSTGGAWTITFTPIKDLVDQLPATGTGWDVYLYDGDARPISSETANMSVSQYTADAQNLAIFDGGKPTDATHALVAGPSVIAVSSHTMTEVANAVWTVDLG
ncbi:MAG: hypothetical protein ABWX65_02360 [Mycetocola sp.]